MSLSRHANGMKLVVLVGLFGASILACGKSEFKGSAEKLNPTVTREFTQASYPKATSTHTQGHTGDPKAESFEQGEWGPLDLLVVVDTSGSMKEEQANLATKLGPLLSHVEKSDWQISVVTTDPVEGCQRALIKKGQADATTRFQAAINAGTQGSGEERGILQAVEGLKGTCRPGAQWVRPGSTVSVLMLTDEDNCHLDETQGYGCAGQPHLKSTFLTDYLKSIRTPGKDARVYAMMWHPSTPKDQCSTALKTGDAYAEVIDATGGKWGSICDADYTKTLEAISKDIAQIVKYEFDLKDTPDDGTLSIKVNGQAWDKYELNGLKVKFKEAPPFGAKVEVSYKHGKSGDLTREFKLDKAPVDGSFKVMVDGEEVGGATWDATKQRLILSTEPAERAEIKIDYKEKTTLNDKFDIGSKTVDTRSLRATINGQVVASGMTYDPMTGSVIFAPAPPEGAKIVVSFRDKR